MTQEMLGNVALLEAEEPLVAEHGGRIVGVKERGLGWVYRHGIHEAPVLAEGRPAVGGLAGRRPAFRRRRPTGGAGGQRGVATWPEGVSLTE